MLMVAMNGFLAVAAFLSLALAVPKSPLSPKCPIILDGRIPKDTPVSTFDTDASPFDPKYTKGQNLTWSQIIKYPRVAPSKFDDEVNARPIEVTINDQSLFASGGTNVQYGFRRAGLLLGNGSDASNTGIRTFHWSIRQDPSRKLNLTHEYMLVWHEANDFASNQWSLNAGILLEQDKPKDTNGSTTGLDKSLWKILDRKNNVIWTGLIDLYGWENFGILMDHEKNWQLTNVSTIQVFYSKGYYPLQSVTKSISNDNSGGGQFQIGVLKKPTETESVVFDGFQEAGIDEGQIYGGIFVENSAQDCISGSEFQSHI
ncbi:hypothetical protein HYALB_00004646 [Hymenoscyphus albidus]|uniref:Glycoside hydrolase 131 catalytic N-terminal domain-containing protein n=1 Tax=Hymenoscyphus albidus TaxID=595503 RepID=A0A9N9QCY5_9HELO|nr:hypothetical protein HYALB_00004646 [Hymenoscyphus albidus]